MTATKALGTYGNAAGVVTPLDHKMAQSGLITKTSTANLVRAGLFYNGTSTIVSGKANMSYDVAAFTAALTRGATAGTVLLTNDATYNVVTTAAPGSNSRYDVVYVWAREFSIDGSNSTPVIGVENGTAAASPTVPSLAAYPGAIELARILVPAGVTATNSGTTITQKAPFTSSAGGIVPVRTTTERDEGTWIESQRVWDISTDIVYVYSGSAWVPAGGGKMPSVLLTRSTNQSIANVTDTTVSWDTISSVGAGWSNASGVITVPHTGFYSFVFGGMWLANGSATGTVRRVYITHNGTTTRLYDNHSVATAATADHAMSVGGLLSLTASDTIQFRVIHNGGVSLNFGPLTSGSLFARIRFDGPA